MSEYLWETDDIEKQVKELENIDEYLRRGSSQNFVDISLPSLDGPATETSTAPAATEETGRHTLPKRRRLLAAAFALVLVVGISVAFTSSFPYNGGRDTSTSAGEIDAAVPAHLSQKRDTLPRGGPDSLPEKVLRSEKPAFPPRVRSTPPHPQGMQEENSKVYDSDFGVFEAKQVQQTDDYEPELDDFFRPNAIEIIQDSTSTDWTSSEDQDYWTSSEDQDYWTSSEDQDYWTSSED
eukprot:scaffold1333_cov130-Skeletonema_dohrnii-CCMP3373.AAC.17